MAKLPAQTVAIEEEPLDSRISETTRIVYGFSGEIIPFNALKARLPCPISRREVLLGILASPVKAEVVMK